MTRWKERSLYLVLTILGLGLGLMHGHAVVPCSPMEKTETFQDNQIAQQQPAIVQTTKEAFRPRELNSNLILLLDYTPRVAAVSFVIVTDVTTFAGFATSNRKPFLYYNLPPPQAKFVS